MSSTRKKTDSECSEVSALTSKAMVVLDRVSLLTAESAQIVSASLGPSTPRRRSARLCASPAPDYSPLPTKRRRSTSSTSSMTEEVKPIIPRLGLRGKRVDADKIEEEEVVELEQAEAQPKIIHLAKDNESKQLVSSALAENATTSAQMTEEKVTATPARTDSILIATTTPVSKPETSVAKPATPIIKPSMPTSKPLTPVAKDATPVVKPATPVAKPATPVIKPATPVVKPATPVVKPVTPVVKPATPVIKPATPVVKPATPIIKPATPIAKPATPIIKPATPIAKPATPVVKTTTPVAKPATPVAKPATPVAKPVTPVAKPATPVANPATPIVELSESIVKIAIPVPKDTGAAIKVIDAVHTVFDIDDDEVIDVEGEGEDAATKVSPVKVTSPTESTETFQKEVPLDTEKVVNIIDDSVTSPEPEIETKQSTRAAAVAKTAETKFSEKTAVTNTDEASKHQSSTKSPQKAVGESKEDVATDIQEKAEMERKSEEKENNAETKAVVYRDKSKYDYSVPLSKKNKDQGLVGRRLSGRFWKSDRDRFRSVIKSRGLKQNFKQRMEHKAVLNRVKEMEKALKEDKQKEREELKARQEANKKKKEENSRKTEIVQVIKNPAKLKRMRKKNIRQLEKRDTTVVQKNAN